MDSFSISVGAVRYWGIFIPWGTNPASETTEWRNSLSQSHRLMWHHAVSAVALVSCRIAASTVHQPETREQNLEAITRSIISNWANVDDSSEKNAMMGFWRKASGYQTTQRLEGHNLFFREASLMKAWNEDHNRAAIQPQPRRFSEITEQAFIASTPQKYTVHVLSVTVITNGSNGPLWSRGNLDTLAL